MAIQQREGGQPAELSSSCAPTDPSQILDILDRALTAPDVTVSRLRFLRHVLEADREVGSYSNWEIAQVIDCAERTARNVKQWGRQFFAAMYVDSPEDLKKENNMHMDATVELAQQQLEAIGWGILDGQRVKDPADLIEEFGALNVLYGCWCCQTKKVKCKSGFLTWWLREGHEAPPGWFPPELRQKKAPEPPAEPQAPETLPERPEPPQELQPVWEDVLTHMEPLIRPSSFRSWIEPLSLLEIEDGTVLLFWAPDGFHSEWVERKFSQPLERICRALGFAGFRLTFPTRRAP
jgi:hypothetical protein